MRTLLGRVVLLLAGLAVIGFAVAASGIVPVKASAGHLPPVRWFLEFAKARSVSTYTLGTETPDLDDPALVLRGAGHYETTCRACHGAPGRDPSEVAAEMTPSPPFLPVEVDQWSPDELFYIVKHGVKMTGMPAWPARERDDEVWAVVAFLLTLPELEPAAYRELALGPAADDAGPEDTGSADPSGVPGSVIASCAPCHGVDGRGRGREVGAFPRIDGQSAAYLAASLRAYAAGTRHSGIMRSVAGELDDRSRERVARYYAERPGDAEGGTPGGVGPGAEGSGPSASAADPSRGETLARRGDAARKIPACVACHGPGTTPRNARYPDLAGQHADYIALQLRLFREGRRGGSAYAPLMEHAAAGLTDDDILDLAAWYASLPWGDGAR